MYFSVHVYGKKLFHGASFKSPSNILLQMVSWTEVSRAIQSNSDRYKTVAKIHAIHQKEIDRFPFDNPVIQTSSSDSLIAASTPVTASPPASATVPPPVLTNTRMRADSKQQTPNVLREPITGKHEVDPIAVGIELIDVLYTDSSAQAKHRMECEEAQRIEGMLAELYKTQGGRSRGWTKSGLKEWMKPRCASGGNIRELDRAKRAFTWQLVCDDKAMSAFLDFLCVAKKIRIAIWFSEEKRVVVYPAADYAGVDHEASYPLYHVDCKGHLRRGLERASDLITFCKDNHYALLPATTVMSSLSKLSLDELASVAEKLGMEDCDGKKNERVAKIASYKLRQRLES